MTRALFLLQKRWGRGGGSVGRGEIVWRPAHGFKGEAPTKPQNLVLLPQKGQTPSKEWSPDCHRGASPARPGAVVLSNLQVPTECIPYRGDPLAPIRSPQRWHQASAVSDKPTCGSTTAGKCIWQTPLFRNSSNSEDKASSTPPALERGSHNTFATVHDPVVKGESSPLPALAGTTVLALERPSTASHPHLMAKV